eukprot:TRINITY_DN4247_c0_g1_i1.p1 TRINITY_DN4247_c0_g1~~TRINITY_DN4247_c0_g1_i1.p1  ORF type:complete len:316 (-),score=72.14 TRINITY_DN4247_c0_g1_i1:58-1005(-)
MNDRSVMTISCGASHSLIYKKNGELFVFGDNSNGQLGLGQKIFSVDKPTLLMTNPTIEIVSVGQIHTILYTSNGDLLGFGDNSFGQLGLGEEIVDTPKLIMNAKIRNVASGQYFTLIYKENGDLLGLGSNSSGQLGLGSFQDKKTPDLIMNDPNIIGIYCGQNHHLIYKRNGDLLGCGDNSCGQLGIGNTETKSKHVLIMNDREIKKIGVGFNHCFIHKFNGDIIAFGDNSSGQLGKKGNYTYIVPFKLMNEPSASILICGERLVDWEPANHLLFSDTFQSRVFYFLRTLKIIHNEKKTKIPKFVVHMIIKFSVD